MADSRLSDDTSAPREIVAIDLGSNSFHLSVGRVIHGEIKVLDKLSDKVMLAAGLDENNFLDEESMLRGLECLQRFAQRLTSFDVSDVRTVATNALRVASNSADFIARAEHILGHEIEIISGREEARLIYLGAAHTAADDKGRRLVIDIGGGSTEFSIGERFETLACESLHMGCVSYAKRFFANEKISNKAFDAAESAARRELWSLEKPFKRLGWNNVLGTSGTIRAVSDVLKAEGILEECVTREGLEKLKKKVLSFSKFTDVNLAGLKPERRQVFVPGLAILFGAFKQLEVNALEYSDGALREGVLYDQLGRLHHEDVRDRTTNALLESYHVDAIHARRVAATALLLYRKVARHWNIENPIYSDTLKRAALLHEAGLAISHAQFHKHGAYLVRYSDLAGFSRQEQLGAACLIRCHRRKFVLAEFAELTDKWRDVCVKLTVILRMAVLLHRSRISDSQPEVDLHGDWPNFQLKFEDGWLAEHPLTESDFLQEVAYLAKADLIMTLL